MPYLRTGIAMVLLFLLGLAWAIFYYPMALTVAGYTQSFAAVINPLVGLDTIRRMGATYFKAFGMVLSIQVVAFTVNGCRAGHVAVCSATGWQSSRKVYQRHDHVLLQPGDRVPVGFVALQMRRSGGD